MPEADPAYWDQMQSDQELQRRRDEMANASAVYNQMQRELTTFGHTLDDPQGARLTGNTLQGLGPIAAQRKAAGDLAPGVQPGSGDRRRMASGVSKASKVRNKVSDALHGVIDPANAAIDYYAGPHLGSALGRGAEAANYVAGATPGLGDAMQLGQAGADYVDAMGAKDYTGAATALGMGTVGAMFLPMAAKGAPLETLDLAKQMEAAGTPAEEIWRKTARVDENGKFVSGWWKAPDGRWRWELPDNELQLTDKGKRLAQSSANMAGKIPPEPLGTLAKHPGYYDAVPGSQGVLSRIVDDGADAGSYSPKTQQIEANGPRVVTPEYANQLRMANMKVPKDQRRVLGHEMQHHASNYYDLPTGSMPGDADHQFIFDADAKAKLGGRLGSDYQVYRRSSDEGLASLTDQRLDYPPEWRVMVSPDSMQTYTPDTQWVREQDGSIWMPDGKGGRIDLSGPRPGWMDTYSSASSSSSGGPRMASVEEGATTPPGNGPRRGRSPIGFGGNGGPNADELLQQALDTPRKVSQRGGYVGAPPNISTPEQEAALVADIVTRLKGYKGKGTNFYDDFQNAIRDWTGSPQMAQKFATASGHTSNQMSPLPNTNHALKAMNQDAVGFPVKAGLYPNASGKKITEDFANNTMSADPKTGQYTYALLPDEHRPPNFADYAHGGERAVFPGRAVHDTWDKEAFGYPRGPGGKQSAASDTEHNFMDRIYNKVVREARRDPELRARLGTGNRTYERAQADLWDIERQKNEKFDVLPAHQIMQENSALTQVAAIPGPSTGISRSLLDAPLEVKDRYTDQMFDAFSDGKGRNAPAAALGMTQPMERGLGQWDGMMEPNRAVRYGVGTAGSGADKVIDPASKTAVGAVRDWNQIGLGQEGGGITVGRSDGATQATSNLAPIGAPLKTYADHDRAFRAVAKNFGDGWQYNVVVQPGKNGEVVLKNIGDMPNEQFQKLAQQVGAEMSPGGGQIRETGVNKKGETTFGPAVERDVGNDFRYVQFDQPGASQYVPDVFKQAPAFQNPNSYHRLFDDTRALPKLKGTFDREIIPKLAEVQKVSDRWEKDMGIPANTVVDRVRRIITEAGPSWPNAIDAAVKKGIIPAFAGAALLGGAANQFGNDRGVQ